MCVDSVGRIILVGEASMVTGQSCNSYAVARLTPSGQLPLGKKRGDGSGENQVRAAALPRSVTLTVPGAQTITLAGDFTNNGAFVPGTGTFILVGGGDQTLAATAPGMLSFYCLTLNKDRATATVTATSKIRATKKLSLIRGRLISA